MPMSLFLAPSLSIDGITIAAALLLTAVLLEIGKTEPQPLKFRHWIIMPVTLIILILGKIVYTPLILLIFLTPKTLFNLKNKHFYLFLTSLAVAGLSYFAWHLLKNLNEPVMAAAITFDFTSFQASDKLLPLLDSKKQLDFLFHNPGAISTIIYRTMQDQGQYYIGSFIGLLGWLDTNLPSWIYLSFPLALITAALNSQPLTNRLLFEKNLLTFVWSLCTGAILLGFYLLSTPVANTIIGGIQGRYFIPAALPLLLTLSFDYNFPVKIRHPGLIKVMNNWASLYTSMVLLTTTYTLWVRYY